jgi:hypothetical protein
MLVTTLALAALALPLADWSVDDDGPADFADLPAAIAAAAPGDTLRIEPGTYSAFDLDKRLTLVGRAGGPRPLVLGESRVHDVDGFVFSGLRLLELLVERVTGRADIDDCEIGHGGVNSIGSTWLTFTLVDCREILVTGSLLQGKTGNDTFGESPGVLVDGSTVSFTRCEIRGGEGGDGGSDGYPGQPGIDADGSFVIVAGCDVSGGSHGEPEIPIFGCEAPGAGAIHVQGSVVIVRGTPDDELVAGFSCGFTWPDPPAIDGTDSSVVVSGVTLHPPSFSPALAVELPSPPEPWVHIAGNPAPGGLRRLNLFGPQGATGLVVASVAPLFAQVPEIAGGPLWVHPDLALLLVGIETQGPLLSANLVFPLPTEDDFAGIPVWFQVFFDQGGGQWTATNPDEIVLRF